MEAKILIGGKALLVYGSDRSTNDTDFLVNDTTSKQAFITSPEVDYLNANGNKFFAEIFKKESKNQIASPESLLELKAYALVQHCQNMNFRKADQTEYDMIFLIRKFNLGLPQIVKKYISAGEYSEVVNIFKRVNK